MCYITELSLGKLNIINSEKYNFEEELKAKSNYWEKNVESGNYMLFLGITGTHFKMEENSL